MSALQLGMLTEVGGAARMAGRRRQLGGEGGGSGRHDAAIHGKNNTTTGVVLLVVHAHSCALAVHVVQKLRGPLQPRGVAWVSYSRARGSMKR